MCQNENFKRGGSYIASSDWIKKDKATINPKNEDVKCFQFTERIQKEFQRLNCLIQQEFQRLSRL